MDHIIEDFWKRLRGVLELLALRIATLDSSLTHSIGKSSNSAFPLKAYLTFLKSSDGEEISVIVDLKKCEGGHLIEADIIGEDGKIIADGPTLKLPSVLDKRSIQNEIDGWFLKFEDVVADKSGSLKDAISRMV